MSSWRPALRIARRTVLRNPARALLVALLVALPVAGATVVDIVARTLTEPSREARRSIGSADAGISVSGYSRLGGSGSHGAGKPRRRRDPRKVDVSALLPAGSRLAPAPLEREILVRKGEGVLSTVLITADAGEPLHRHEAMLTAGRPARADEVLVSPALAGKLDLLDGGGELRPDATVRLPDGPAASVAGLARQQFCLSCELMMAPPGSAVARAAARRRSGYVPVPFDDGSGAAYLVDLPEGTPVAELRRALAARGISLTPRSSLIHDGDVAHGVTSDHLRAAALVTIVVGLGLLEVVLLAGTAFAVGARRQMREVGLAAANGASARDVKRIVLAQGLVLGALGAAIGIAAGVPLALAGRPLWQRITDEQVTTWAYGPWEILAAGCVGLLSGLAAAVVPAAGAARMRPVDALALRFRRVRSRGRRSTLTGSALVAIGALGGLAGDRLLAGDFAHYERALAAVAKTGDYVSPPSADGPLALIIGGATLAVVGLVLLAPALIAWLSRLGPHLPLSGRLAARDAARHRHRTGPATGAITVAVAGSIVMAFLVAGASRGEQLRYVAALPPHVLSVEPAGDDGRSLDAAAAGAAARLPEGRRHAIRIPVSEEGPLYVGRGLAGCPPGLERSARCEDENEHTVGSGELAVATTSGVADVASAGRLDRAARDALARGEALVFDRALLDEAGTFTVTDDAHTTRLRGHFVDRGKAYSALPSALVPPGVVRDKGWKTTTESVLVSFAAGTDRSAIDRAQNVADHAGVSAFVERGATGWDGRILPAIALISALVTLLGVAISVALSAAEGRADLATLAAVGAPPHRRRTLVAGQALVIGGLGCALGVALGTFVAFTARATTGAPGFVVPWGNLLATGVAVPLLAALVAALCARSRLPLVRRAD